ncbi:hypothetical protein K439DRAFT_1621968 [Ramaria rubella]|nr:hypothetical protein K439DRAFT_1621968 [Ramaria rubella]
MSAQEELATLIQEKSDLYVIYLVSKIICSLLPENSISYTYILIAAFALLAYDALFTFPSEVKFIWQKKFWLGTILYLLAHYPALLQLLGSIYLEFSAFPSLQDLQFCAIFCKYVGITAYNWNSRSIVCKSICYIQSSQTGFCGAGTFDHYFNFLVNDCNGKQ